MNSFEEYQKQSRENLVRTVGLSLDKFQDLVNQINAHIKGQKQNNPLKS